MTLTKYIDYIGAAIMTVVLIAGLIIVGVGLHCLFTGRLPCH